MGFVEDFQINAHLIYKNRHSGSAENVMFPYLHSNTIYLKDNVQEMSAPNFTSRIIIIH